MTHVNGRYWYIIVLWLTRRVRATSHLMLYYNKKSRRAAPTEASREGLFPGTKHERGLMCLLFLFTQELSIPIHPCPRPNPNPKPHPTQPQKPPTAPAADVKDVLVPGAARRSVKELGVNLVLLYQGRAGVGEGRLHVRRRVHACRAGREDAKRFIQQNLGFRSFSVHRRKDGKVHFNIWQ